MVHDEAWRKRRNQHLKRTYNITLEQYEEILEYQGGVCPSCLRKPRENETFVLEHDHTAHIVRGVCCSWCNLRIIGKRRNGDLLIRAGEYINDPPAQHVLPEGHKTPQKKRQPRKRPRK